VELESARYLSEPILTSPGQPLRVAVYSRISHGIRDGVLPAGQILPRETELADSLGVSRTVVREALMLLEEDGHIVTRRGVGRFVADTVPHIGLERFQTVESLLGEPLDSLEVDVIEFTRQEPTDFVTTHMAIDDSTHFWFRESIIRRAGHPMALVQEYVPEVEYLAGVSRPLADAFRRITEAGPTMLETLLATLGPALAPVHCVVSASIAGPTRARHLDLAVADPVLLLTQSAAVNGTPVYLAKSAFTPESGHLSVAQSTLTR
jgi:GntR family transcriptional regulator